MKQLVRLILLIICNQADFEQIQDKFLILVAEFSSVWTQIAKLLKENWEFLGDCC